MTQSTTAPAEPAPAARSRDSARSIAICGRALPAIQFFNNSFRQVEIEGVRVTCGVIRNTAPAFDRFSPAQAHSVLVRVKAFSCNYRDRSLALQMALCGRPDGYYVIGSEFVGTVVDAGVEVRRVAVGDRVIADNAWPDGRRKPGETGIPTNHASCEYLVLPEVKVIAIPDTMPDVEAAAFGIGAQTTYSMLRKARPAPGNHVLVTAAKSNTSLFTIGALCQLGANVYVTTTSTAFGDELRELGVREVFVVNPSLSSFAEHPQLRGLAKRIGGFDCVFDPFFDLHIHKVIPLIAFGGCYVSCGLFDQHLRITGGARSDHAPDYQLALTHAVAGNVCVIGNCLGTTDDLRRALDDYGAGRIRVIVDSVLDAEDAGTLLHRTFNARDRFGKVVARYA